VRRFLLVGLTGSIATGKSTVSAMFRELGCVVLDADVLARDVVAPGEPALAQIVEEFGRDVLQADGTLDRKKLGAIVFGDAARRKRLEQITHPAIRDRFLRHLADLEARGFEGLVLWDAPVMIETGGHKAMDRLVVVATDEATQAARLRARDTIDAAEAERKIRSQMPVAEKAKLADYVIDNAGDRAATQRQVGRVHAALAAEARLARTLLTSHSTRRAAALGVVFPVNLGTRGRNEVSPAVVFQRLRAAVTTSEFLGYHWRRSGAFVFLRPDREFDAEATAAVTRVTGLEAVARPFSALARVDWRVPLDTSTTARGSVVLGDTIGTWRLVSVFLSEEIPSDQRVSGTLTSRIRIVEWVSGSDVLCAYDRPSEPGDVGQVTRAVVLRLTRAGAGSKVFGSGRALSVVRDILCARGVRHETGRALGDGPRARRLEGAE